MTSRPPRRRRFGAWWRPLMARLAPALLTALASTAPACVVDEAGFDARVFRCDTAAPDPLCGKDSSGQPMTCFAARQIGGADFCTRTCSEPMSLPDQGAVCVQGNALLSACDPSDDRPGIACGVPELGCLRTDVLTDEGVCVTMQPCSQDIDCHDPVRSTCAATFLTRLYGGADEPSRQPSLLSPGRVRSHGHLLFTRRIVPAKGDFAGRQSPGHLRAELRLPDALPAQSLLLPQAVGPRQPGGLHSRSARLRMRNRHRLPRRQMRPHGGWSRGREALYRRPATPTPIARRSTAIRGGSSVTPATSASRRPPSAAPPAEPTTTAPAIATRAPPVLGSALETSKDRASCRATAAAPARHSAGSRKPACRSSARARRRPARRSAFPVLFGIPCRSRRQLRGRRGRPPHLPRRRRHRRNARAFAPPSARRTPTARRTAGSKAKRSAPARSACRSWTTDARVRAARSARSGICAHGGGRHGRNLRGFVSMSRSYPGGCCPCSHWPERHTPQHPDPLRPPKRSRCWSPPPPTRTPSSPTI